MISTHARRRARVLCFVFAATTFWRGGVRAEETHLPQITPPAIGADAAGDAAVVVGIERYPLLGIDVPYAQRDADLFHRFLLDTVGIPRGRISNLHARAPDRDEFLEEVQRRAGEVARGGTLWIYFAGHGAPALGGDDAHLLGVDARATVRSIRNNSVRRSRLLEIALGSPAGQVVVVLDACFSGQTRSGTALTKDRFAVPDTLAVVPKVAVWTAASASEVSGPCEAVEHGVFTYFVVGALTGWADRDGDGAIQLGEAASYVKDAVASALSTGARAQTPELVTDDALRSRVLTRPPERRGPDLDLLSRVASCVALPQAAAEAAKVSVANPGSIPMASLPEAMGAVAGSFSFKDLDVAALEAWDAALKYDAGDATAEEKADRWDALARAWPQLRDRSTARAGEWRDYVSQREAAEVAQEAMEVGRAAAWDKLSRLLTLDSVGITEKITWAEEFNDAYGWTRATNPYARRILEALPLSPLAGQSHRWIFSEAADLHLTHTEITVAQYRTCVKEGECDPAEHESVSDSVHCNWGRADRDLHPMNCVTHQGAVVFCKWIGGRLPTESEWRAEASDRGVRTWPWGEAPPTCEHAAWRGHATEKPCDPEGSTQAVCYMPLGSSAAGLCDMGGNVWEWTSTAEDDDRVLCGGSWTNDSAELIGARSRYLMPADFWNFNIGFRCAHPGK